MKRKWKDDRGETLIEVLASVLIGALSVALLFTAVMASVNMDRNAQDTDEAFYEHFNDAEEQNPDEAVSVPSSKVKVKNGAVGTNGEAEISVNFYGGDGVWSYALVTPVPVTPP